MRGGEVTTHGRILFLEEIGDAVASKGMAFKSARNGEKILEVGARNWFAELRERLGGLQPARTC